MLTYVFSFNSGCVVVMGKSGSGNVDWRPTDVFVSCRDQQSNSRRTLRTESREPVPQAGERQRLLTAVGLSSLHVAVAQSSFHGTQVSLQKLQLKYSSLVRYN